MQIALFSASIPSGVSLFFFCVTRLRHSFASRVLLGGRLDVGPCWKEERAAG